MSLTSFGSAAVKSFLTNEEMEAWKYIAIGMMSEEETTGDGKIERRRPSWRSEEYTIGWMSWIDGEHADTWKVARKERIDGSLLQLQAPAGLQAWMVKS